MIHLDPHYLQDKVDMSNKNFPVDVRAIFYITEGTLELLLNSEGLTAIIG